MKIATIARTLGLLLIVTSVAQAAAAVEYNGDIHYKAVGASNVTACDADGGREAALVNAQAQATDAAERSCSNLGRKAQMITTLVIYEYRGSCWAGIDAALAVEMTYICR